MKLHPRPFERMRAGKKTIELRLFDKKRSLIKIGDSIRFHKLGTENECLLTKVQDLHVFKDFIELYKNLPLEQCGYVPSELSKAKPEDMEIYYSREAQLRYGVLGIKLQLVKENDSLLPDTEG